MKTAIWLFGIHLIVAGAAQAASLPDTTLKASAGMALIHGQLFDGSEVAFRISGRSVIADTPRGSLLIREYPEPHPARVGAWPPDEAQVRFEDTLTVVISRLRREKRSLTEMRQELDAFCRSVGVADSVVPWKGGDSFSIYYHGGDADLLVVAGGGAGEPRYWPSDETIRHAAIGYANRLVAALNRDCLLFVSKPGGAVHAPIIHTLDDNWEKRQALAEIFRVLSGETGGRHYVRGLFFDELRAFPRGEK